MATAKQMAKRRELVLKTLKKLKKARYQEILDAISNSGGSDEEINYHMVRNVLKELSERELENDTGSIEDKGNGVWEYKRARREKEKPSFAAYGYRWKRNAVNWELNRGRRARGAGNPKQLLGKRLDAKKSDATEVDFATQVGLYLLHKGDQTVYVGRVQRAKNEKRGLYDRLREHTKDKLKDDWDEFSWFGFNAVGKDGKVSPKHYIPSLIGNEDNLLQIITTIEAVIINGTRPRGNNRRGDLTRNLQYDQV